MRDSVKRDVALILLTLMPVGCSTTAHRPTQAPSALTRPVEISERDKPRMSRRGSCPTAALQGRVTDAESGTAIPDSTVLIATLTGNYDSRRGVFQMRFPPE
jgi:hypothetical protein